MEIKIKGGPTELNQARARIAYSVSFKNDEEVAKARRDYKRLRANVIIAAGQQMLAEVDSEDES